MSIQIATQALDTYTKVSKDTLNYSSLLFFSLEENIQQKNKTLFLFPFFFLLLLFFFFFTADDTSHQLPFFNCLLLLSLKLSGNMPLQSDNNSDNIHLYCAHTTADLSIHHAHSLSYRYCLHVQVNTKYI